MNWKLLVVGIIVVIFLSGCLNQPESECEAPSILIGGFCCSDADSDGACDSKKVQEPEPVAEEEPVAIDVPEPEPVVPVEPEEEPEEPIVVPVDTCDDGVMNQDEEDVDCGGSCEPCPAAVCNVNADCPEKEYGALYCNMGDVARVIKRYSCTGPGTPEAECISKHTLEIITRCEDWELCDDAKCINTKCFNCKKDSFEEGRDCGGSCPVQCDSPPEGSLEITNTGKLKGYFFDLEDTVEGNVGRCKDVLVAAEVMMRDDEHDLYEVTIFEDEPYTLGIMKVGFSGIYARPLIWVCDTTENEC